MRNQKETLQEKRAKLSASKLALLQKRLETDAEIIKTNGDLYAQLPTIVPDLSEKHEPFPLTDVQQAYWIGRNSDLELGNVSIHAYVEYDYDGLDVARFEWAWQQVINRHDMMRAIVRPDGQQQILAEVPPYHIEVLDLCGQAPEQVEAQLEAIRQEMSHQMMVSDQWPLFDIRASMLDGGVVRLHVSTDLLTVDASSLQILRQELSQLYHHPATTLPPLELSFRDYVLAERALRESELYQRSWTYWQDRLPTLSPAPELPLAVAVNSLTSPQFVRREARVEPETWQRLKTQATQVGLTPSGMLLAAFAEVLTVWSKNPQFTINLTLFNRWPMHAQVNDIMGDFTSLTLLEVKSAVQDSFEARARRVQEQLWQDLDHRYVSGVQVMRELARTQRGSRKAMMPIVFTSTLVLASPDQEDVANLDTSDDGRLLDLEDSIYLITQTPQVWLDHQVSEQSGALVFAWDAVEALFPAGLLDEMFAAYCELLARLAEEPEAWAQNTADLLPLPAAQAAQRQAVNDTQGEVSHELLHTLFNAQAEQQPGATAVVSGEQRLSYERLQRYSRQIGHWLRQQGAAPNSLVAVVMEKGWEQVAAVLGVMQAGAAYLPIAADLPPERLNYLLEHGQVQCILTQSHLDRQLTWAPGYQRLCVDGDLSGLAATPLAPVQGPADLAYVIYTSGSTGLPKGVAIDHRGAVNTIVDLNERYQVGPADRVLALSALNFDLSVYDIFGTLAAGGTVVIPDEAARRDPGHWAGLLVQEQVTVWNSVPALMEMLVEYQRGQAAALPASLRLVWLSGDWIPLSLPDQIKALAPGAEVVSMGGATEASIWSILYPIDSVAAHWSSIPYGRPMRNQSFHVLDEGLAPRPVWVPGQLYIGGIGLAQGYWRDEEKTAASFIRHPRTGERLYRTGDLGRYLPDGNIEFLGREDFQVKIRGHRIELGEIETALAQHPAVRASVVTATGPQMGDKQLVAYIVPDRELLTSASEQQSSPEEQHHQEYMPDQEEGILLDPIERLKFKLSHPGFRPIDSHQTSVQLVKPEFNEELIEKYVARRSYRKFDSQPVPFVQFSQFLSCLLPAELEGVPLPKYQYASAGSLYPVQVYLYIKPNRVEGLAGGTYYYHPALHQLIPLSADPTIDDSLYTDNHEIFDGASFAMYFVGQLDAITPMYGEWSKEFCFLEAGLMVQLLETSAPAHQIGLCQIGGFNFDAIRHKFGLNKGHVYIHSLLGGRISVTQTKLPALVQGTSDLRFLLELLQEETEQERDSVPVQQVASSSAPILTEKPESVLIEELRSFLQDKIPAYMVPSTFTLLDSLPLTPNGKVNRQALPQPDVVSHKPEKAFVAPQSEIEQTIAAIWQEVLQVDKVGIHDNFFDLGGNSVHLIRVHSKLRQIVNEELSVIKMFECPTIDTLIKYINQEQDQRSSLQQSSDRAQTRRASRARRRRGRD